VAEGTWAEQALRECLRALAADADDALGVTVVDSWTIAPDAFCVTYRHPYYEGILGCLEQLNPDDPDAQDPVRVGAEVAMFGIAEPLGAEERQLIADADGVRWTRGEPPPSRR
jgi:hypothetical protein